MLGSLIFLYFVLNIICVTGCLFYCVWFVWSFVCLTGCCLSWGNWFWLEWYSDVDPVWLMWVKVETSPEHHLGQAVGFPAEEVLHLDVEPLHVDRNVGVLHNPQLAVDHVHLGHARDGGAGEGGWVRGWRQALVQLKWSQDSPERNYINNNFFLLRIVIFSCPR